MNLSILLLATAGTIGLSPMIAFASGDIPFAEPAELAREIGILRKNGIRDLAFFRLQEYAPQCLDVLLGQHGTVGHIKQKGKNEKIG